MTLLAFSPQKSLNFHGVTHPIAKVFIVIYPSVTYIWNQISCDCGIKFCYQNYCHCSNSILKKKFDIFTTADKVIYRNYIVLILVLIIPL